MAQSIMRESSAARKARRRAIARNTERNDRKAREKQQAKTGLYPTKDEEKRIRKSRMKSAGKAGRAAASTALKFSGGY